MTTVLRFTLAVHGANMRTYLVQLGQAVRFLSVNLSIESRFRQAFSTKNLPGGELSRNRPPCGVGVEFLHSRGRFLDCL
jgi:hypothetical protein